MRIPTSQELLDREFERLKHLDNMEIVVSKDVYDLLVKEAKRQSGKKFRKQIENDIENKFRSKYKNRK